MHFWANDDAAKLAKGMRAALDKVNIAKQLTERPDLCRTCARRFSSVLAARFCACRAARSRSGAGRPWCSSARSRSKACRDASTTWRSISGASACSSPNSATAPWMSIDLAAGRSIHRIGGLSEPQGVGYAPGPTSSRSPMPATDRSACFAARISRRRARSISATMPTTCGSMRATGKLVVGYGSGGLAVIDPASRRRRAASRCPAIPRAFSSIRLARRAFVNVPDARQIAVVDLATGEAGRKLARAGSARELPDGARRAGHGPRRDGIPRSSATGASRHRAAARCGRASRPAAMPTTCSSIPGAAASTSVAAKGWSTCWRKRRPAYRRLDRIKTASGARTSLFVPELDRLFVAARSGFLGFGSDAAILVLRPEP